MAKALLSVNELMAQSWELIKKHWNDSFRISIGFLGLSIASFLLALIGYKSPLGYTPILRLADAVLIQILGTAWVTMRLTQLILKQDQTKPSVPANTETKQWHLLMSYIWVSLLGGLAILGGALIFVIPGIWLTLVLSFSTLSLLENGLRGTQALAASADLVKGRWWQTLWRLLAPTILIGIVFFVLTVILNLIVRGIAGYTPSDVVDQSGAAYWWFTVPKQTYIALAANEAINSLAFSIFAPFFITISVKLFHNLKETQ